ncbi:hypothetical protein DRP77_03540 [Candidatus Poribacteria bacterium]|nr:MAG: hypothetical protein DRP77_03540 [Candidatus Poribacteria bacterium]
MEMVEVRQGSITDVECDVAVVNLFRGVKHPGGATGAMDRAMNGAITRAIADFDGELGECLVLDGQGSVKAKKVLVVGLGSSASFGYEEVEKAAYAAAKEGLKHGRTIATIIHGAGIGGLDPVEAAKRVASGSKKAFEEAGASDAKLLIVEFNPEKAKAVEEALKGG